MSIQQTTLPNGLRVVTDTIPHVQTASLGMWVDVGARHETSEINGVSHMLEHMAFKGTKKRSAVQIAQEIENVGGHMNAYTSRESTAYYVRVLKESVDLGVDIVSDILQNSTFESAEFERERGVIIQEIGQTNDTPDDIVFDYFQETCFPDQPMGWPILGTVPIIQSITPETVEGYMKRFYAAENMVFAAAGNVDHKHIVDLVGTYFTSLQKEKERTPVPARYVGGDKRVERDLEQVHVVMGFEGLPFGHEDYYAMSVLSTILGGGMSSRLFQEVREKRGLVYSIYSYASSARDVGVFGIYAGTGPDEVGELLPVVCEQLRTVGTTLTPQEINRAKAQLKSSLLMGMESTSNRCERLANQFLVYKRAIEVSEIVAKIDAVDMDALSRMSAAVFHKIPTLTALGPIDHIPSYDRFKAALQA